MTDTIGYSATKSLVNALNTLEPMRFNRRDVGPEDVQIEILYCGVCHSDVHQVKNEWSNTVYPCMPGHEIAGRVTQVGSAVASYKPGDMVAVGCMIDSCGQCPGCTEGNEQYCEGPNSFLATYNGYQDPADKSDPVNTFGGYSERIVVKEHFVVRIPAGMDPRHAGPICCAGVTTYSPIKHFGVKAGMKTGVVGLGGLGHMAVKILKALGAHVTVFTTTEEKETEAIAKLGADAVIYSKDDKAMAASEVSFDFIINTIPEPHDINPYVCQLKRDGTMAVVGVIGVLDKLNMQEMIMHRRAVGGSLIGSIAETQEVLDFFADNHIAPELEMIDIKDINEAYKKIEKGVVRFRYVIDMASLRTEDRDGAAKAPDKQATY